MKKCSEINELLSAYSDNELTKSEKQTVEEHLAACENCSALLEIYRKISISIDEASAPVPEALRIGVMNRIRSESLSVGKETAKKKWWQHQVLLTRLAPIAACLAVVVLVWQFSSNNSGLNSFNRNENDSASPEAASLSLPAPNATPMPDSPVDRNNFGESDEDDIMADEAIGFFDEQSFASGGTDEQESFDPMPEREWSYEYSDSDDMEERFSDFLKNAFAEITITGALPEFLTSYEPLPLDNWQGWELVFEIPSTEVDNLMLELVNRRSSLVLNPDNKNSQYAIVFYSHR